jgi:hypothetical protein
VARRTEARIRRATGSGRHASQCRCLALASPEVARYLARIDQIDRCGPVGCFSCHELKVFCHESLVYATGLASTL